MQRRNESGNSRELDAQQLVASGGVIFRSTNEVPEVALISTGKIWCLPKGTIEMGETFEKAALREVEEETGLKGEIVKKIGEISYSFFKGTRYCKTVHFYLLKCVGGSVDVHDSEAEDVRWFHIPEALQKLAYPKERTVVELAQKMLTGKDGSGLGQ